MKSSSRASLLAPSSNGPGKCKKNGYNTAKSLEAEASQLKRFKSLPSGKINRRMKRKAPSPPKNVEPYRPQNTSDDPKTATQIALGDFTTSNTISINQTQGTIGKIPHQAQPSSLCLQNISSPKNTACEKENSEEATCYNSSLKEINELQHEKQAPKCPEGVKLRRRAKCLQQKYNFNQRQSMYCAQLQQFSNFFKGDNRRHSFYGVCRQEIRVPSVSLENVLDDSQEDILARRNNNGNNTMNEYRKINTNLLRSPSDSSLMYLHQIALASNANIASGDSNWRSNNDKTDCKENHCEEESALHRIGGRPILPPKSNARNAQKLKYKESEHKAFQDTETVSGFYSDKNCIRDITSPQVQMTSSSRTESQQSHYSFYTNEAIYDTVPTPRSCLSREQLEHNHIYDIPRKLMAKTQKLEGMNQHDIIHHCNPHLMHPTNKDLPHHPRYQERSSSSFEHGSKKIAVPRDCQLISKSNYGSVTSINSTRQKVPFSDDHSLEPCYGNISVKIDPCSPHMDDENVPKLPPRLPRIYQADVGPTLPPKNKNSKFQEMSSYNRCLQWSNDARGQNYNCDNHNGYYLTTSDCGRITNPTQTKFANSMDNIDMDNQGHLPLKEQHYERCQSYTATNGMPNDQFFVDNKLSKPMEYSKTPFGEVSSSFTESTSTLKSTTSIDTFSSLPPPPTNFELYPDDLSTSLYSLEREFASLPPIHSDGNHEGLTVNKNCSQNLSTFSSVSSVTLLQEGDGMSLDNSSLPGDPFPQGLPNTSSSRISTHSTSSSSTLESPIPSPIPPPKFILPPYEGCNEEYIETSHVSVSKNTEEACLEYSGESTLSRSGEVSIIVKHSSESNLSRIDVEFENVEEQEYTLLPSIDQVRITRK